MQVTNSSTATGATTSSSAGATPAAADKTNTIQYDQFLKLLVAQMQYQDPTQPTDSGQFLSQLASFSGVEQTVQTNQKLDTLLTTSSISQADSLVGRTVTSADGKSSGKVVSVAIQSSGLIAAMADGSTMPIGAGVTIS